MQLIRNKSPARLIIINSLWIFTAFSLSGESSPYSPVNNSGWVSVVAWLFMLIGAYAFYSSLFRFYDWYNNK